jgi:indolepyruvate ferredoxin oxidoreductase
MPGDFTADVSFALPTRRVVRALEERTPAGRLHLLDTTAAASKLFGDAIAANMMMLGTAWQAGALPLTAEAIEAAIRLNGTAVEMNLAAFRWGRRAAADPAALETALAGAGGGGGRAPELSYRRLSETLDELIARRRDDLIAYQDTATAERYAGRVHKVRMRAKEIAGGDGGAGASGAGGGEALAEAVARNLYKLMAIKDEYEVARLYSDGTFAAQLASELGAWERLELHLAPPFLDSGTDPRTGRPRKRAFGPWILKLMPLLAKARRWRGTSLDVFARNPERREERRVLAEYEALVDRIAAEVTAESLAAATALAGYPDLIRGFGPVKSASIAAAEAERDRLLATYEPAPAMVAAE